MLSRACGLNYNGALDRGAHCGVLEGSLERTNYGEIGSGVCGERVRARGSGGPGGRASAEAISAYGTSVDVVLAAVSDDLTVRAAQAVTLQADAPLSTLDLTQFDIAIVPGGSVGVDNLGKSQRVVAELTRRMEAGEYVAAICAGPMVLANAGLLTGRKAVCYPGCEEGWPADIYQAGKDVFVDGNLITATGPGTALSFGIQILRTLEGDKVADEVASGMLLK